MNALGGMTVETDLSYIVEVRTGWNGNWQQTDILLTGGYGWQYMLQSADYVRRTDLHAMNLAVVRMPGAPEKDCTALLSQDSSLADSELKDAESGALLLSGSSQTMRCLMRIVWFNQTQAMRIFVNREVAEDEMRLYAARLICRTFENDAGTSKPAEEKEPRKTPADTPVRAVTGEADLSRRGGAVLAMGLGACWLVGGAGMLAALSGETGGVVMGCLILAAGIATLALSIRTYLRSGGRWQSILRGYAKVIAVIAGFVVFMEVVISQSSSPYGFSPQVTLVSAAVLAGCIAVLKLVKRQKRKVTEA